MKKFKRGDRVRIYSFAVGVVSGVVTHAGSDWLDIFADDGSDIIAHYKQCRRLKRRIRCGAV